MLYVHNIIAVLGYFFLSHASLEFWLVIDDSEALLTVCNTAIKECILPISPNASSSSIWSCIKTG